MLTSLFLFLLVACSPLLQGRNLSTNRTGLFPYVYTAPLSAELPKHASVYEAINDVEDALSDMGPPQPSAVLVWTPQDVYAYLSSLGFDSDVCSKFVEHKITGKILLELELALLKELDITSFGTRFELNKVIQSLRTASQGRSTPSTPSQAQSQYKHNSTIFPVDADLRSRMSARDSIVHTRQRSRSLDNRDEPRHSVMPSFDKNWQLPSSPQPQSPPQSPPQPVTPLVPVQRLSPYNNGLQSSPDQAVDGTLDALISAPSAQNSPVLGQPQLPFIQPSSPQEQRRSVASSATEASRNSYLEEANQRALYQQQLSSPNVSQHDVEPMGDPHSDSQLASSSPATSYARSASGTHVPPLPTNSSSTTIHSSAANSVPRTPDLTSMSYDASLDSKALKGRVDTGLGLSYPNSTQREAVGNRVISAPIPTAMSPSAKAEQTLRSASANAAKPKKLSKQNTSAFVEGRIAVTPTLSASTADHSGWMSKRGGSGVGVWKNRFFVLHGTRLSYFASNSDQKEKGLIDITAHKVVPVKASEDKLVALYAASTGAGRYCFKLVPPAPGSRKGVTFTAPKTHYFAVDSHDAMRSWMNVLMRATIDRDDSVPVISSYTTPTVSLAKAREISLLAMEARAEELRLEVSTRNSSETVSSNASTPELSMSEPRSEGDAVNIEGFKEFSISS